ncbi:MAG: hypothetical protein ACO207_00515 [Bacilli bacterium]
MAINQSKIKRLMTNFIGASASVAVVTAVASVTIAVEARFLNVDVFENRAFYTIEVIENVIVEGSGSLPSSLEEPTEPALVQLRVENQWDNYVIALAYGVNRGAIEPLRSNQAYTLTIELEDTLGWRTLDTYTFNTRPRTNAFVTSIQETTTPLSTSTTFDINLITQDGFTNADAWEAVLTYGTQVETRPLSVGEQTLNWSNIPHQNAEIKVEIFATINSERKLIKDFTQLTTPFVDASIDLRFPTVDTFAITPMFNNGEQPGEYFIEWIDSEEVSEVFDLTNDGFSIENLTANESYSLKWYLTTADERTFLILEQTIIPIDQPYFVLSVTPTINGVTFELTIDRNSNLDSLYLSIGDFNLATAYPMVLVQENEDVSFFTLTLESGIPLGSSLALTLVQASPYAYPITFYSFNFQGGIPQ